MTSEEATLAVITALEELAIPYMLVGSFSSNYYGIARSTNDADFVIQLGPDSLSRLVMQLGPAFRLDPQIAFETTTLTSRHRLQVAGNCFTIELFHLSEDPHDQERFGRRRRVPLLNREVSLPTVEDVIITKLRWALGQGRSKDWEDVRNIIAVQGAVVDWPYVHRWSDQHGTRAVLEEIRRTIPPLSEPPR